MNIKKKILCGLLAVTAMSSSMFVGVIASEKIQEITAAINYGVKMKVDNVEWNPTEADGSAVRPITYNGRTYLPVRALGDKLGIAIDWEAETETVFIGEKEWTPVTATMVKANSDMGFTKDPDQLFNGSGYYDFGCFVSKKWITNDYSNIEITPGTNFSKMKMSVYSGGGDKTITIKDEDTKAILKSAVIKANTSTDFEFDISGTKKIKINWDGDNTDTLVFGDIYMK